MFKRKYHGKSVDKIQEKLKSFLPQLLGTSLNSTVFWYFFNAGFGIRRLEYCQVVKKSFAINQT